jgi:hypothetical protein
MIDAVLLLEAVAIGILFWGAFLCLGRRDRRSSVRDRRAGSVTPPRQLAASYSARIFALRMISP